jgi:hypothetical protein
MAVGLVPPETVLLQLRRFDLRTLWRHGAWGFAAAMALIAAALATQTETGSRRLAALASAELPVRAIATVPIPKQDAQVARMAAELHALAADRDRLADRVASLERSIEDMTGSIKRVERAAIQPAMPPILSMVPISSAPTPAAPQTIFPAASPQDERSQHAQADAQGSGMSAELASSQPASDERADTAREAVPLPPQRIAALPAEPARPEFGIALASSSSLDVLHLQWAALKANYGPMLAGLRPIAVREQVGAVTRYRLVLGPLPDLASAARLCARLTAARAPCHAGRYSGEPL